MEGNGFLAFFPVVAIIQIFPLCKNTNILISTKMIAELFYNKLVK
jgi:hypothetical protein